MMPHILVPVLDVVVGAPRRLRLRRFLRDTQPSLLTCLPRAIASASAGTSFVIDDPAATYAPLPTRTGAMSCVSLPMNAPSSMTVGCFVVPS